MENSICQSCSMPITSNDLFGTNKDGSVNKDYCVYCYQNGNFIDNVTLEEYIDMNVKFASQAGMTEEQMRKHCEEIFPTLKRWKSNYS